tara:strand:- start:18852 stop:19853 length:1002 start_codon:yes stop_codon:yes gene_type:complete
MIEFSVIRLTSFPDNSEFMLGERAPAHSSLHQKYQFQYFWEEGLIIDIYQVKAFVKSNLILNEYISVMREKENIVIGQFGYALRRPYLNEGLSVKNAATAILLYIEEIKKISNKYEKSQCIFSSNHLNAEAHPLERTWFKKLYHDLSFEQVDFFSVVDLNLPVSEIKKRMRRSFKSLVTHDANKLRIDIIDSSNAQVADIRRFQKFHKLVSGRATRSTLTWDIQYQMIKKECAFIVEIYELRNNKHLASSLIEFSGSESLYSIGAYDRTRRDLPLGHITLFNAILQSKLIGSKKMVIGNLLGYSNKATEKEKSISDFKAGFSTHIDAEYIFKF